MTWDPDVYMKFANERTRPAVELLARVPVLHPKRVIDLGCGPGNSTAILCQRWPDADIEGLESSPEMIAKAKGSGVRANFVEGDVETWSPRGRYDVVFSNATLHWIAHHEALVPRLFGFVEDGGALAFQVPQNFHEPSHVLMREVANSGPWAEKLKGARQIHVREPDFYYAVLAPHAKSLDIWETEYLQALDGEDPVLAWVSGTGLRPFVQPLEPTEREYFIAEYRHLLREAYPRREDGKTLFPFRRLFVVATR